MTDTTKPSTSPSGLRPLLGISPEMKAALEDPGTRGCSFDPKTQTVTIRGGTFDGLRFRPTVQGIFERMPES